ncbi:cadherin-1-like [Trichomycterus rosablanca]|uniref:cadherin-1-like n=1 Tax=Trichomycterus rosablanca TaxID=2290929 RepID=UPI002F35DBA6
MESLRTMHLAILLFLLQVAWCEYAESEPCSSGFTSHLFTFRVHRERLHRGTEVGKVLFSDCSGQTQPLFDSDDEQFQVSADGTVKLMGPITLDNGHKSFTVHAQDSAGMKHTAYVRVDLEDRDWHQKDTEEANLLQTESHSNLPVLEFPKSSGGLRRRKRDLVIPPIRIIENEKGPFPKRVAEIKSSKAKESKMVYEISGEGANLPPVGIFTIDRSTGWLSVSKPLDREVKPRYVLQVKVFSPVDPNIMEPPMEVIVEVMDQNDNRPVFTQDPFLGSVPEVSKIGFEFMTTTATDADDPNTLNGDIRYTIISQDPALPRPNMFAIHPITGAIRLNSEGLDRAKYPKYILEIQAADMEGNGLLAKGRTVITVTDGNAETDHKSEGMQLIVSQIIIPENDRGPFPKQIAQIKSSHSKKTNMVYSIKGEGADQPPVNVFSVDKSTGWLSVSGPLDREIIKQYELEAHAVSADGSVHEPPMKIHILVIDQNDNKPVFTQPQFQESVAQASEIGFELLTVTATDADDPNSDNGEIRYTIISQDPALPKPNMFDINPNTGAIKVNAEGLDRKKYPKYTLEVQAADMHGNGFTVRAKAVIAVTSHLAASPSKLPAEAHFLKPTRRRFKSATSASGFWCGIKHDLCLSCARGMEAVLSVRCGLLLVLLQVVWCGYAEKEPCSPGFTSDLFHFKVYTEHLTKGTRLGTVVFDDCTGRTRTLFDSADRRFHLNSDGTVKVKRPVTLHDGHKVFTVHAWDSNGKKHTAHVKVEHVVSAGHHHGHHHGHQKHTEPVQHAQKETPSDLPVLEFPKSSGGLRRRKREWVIPPFQISENEKGPFPKHMVQIKSNKVRETKMVYEITGEGANLPPVGLFTIDRSSGWLSVSRPLDREAKPRYVLQAKAFSPVDPSIFESPMDVIVEVMDQNDNRPVFTQDPFLGSVPEVSKIGYEFMTVNATDADDPSTTNADIIYTIIKQEPLLPQPNMFDINPVSGAIRVNADGLDKEKYPKYILEIQAADMEGKGLTAVGRAVITVSDSNDNAPQFEKSSYNVSVPENQVNVEVVRMLVTDGDEELSPAWAATFKIVTGNSAGFFSISTGPSKQEGIITTVKPLDYEKNRKIVLEVAVENDAPFALPMTTSTATVTVNVLDVNEAPVFDPVEKEISRAEDLAVDSELTVYTATDPDIEKSQKLTYRVNSDPAGWLNVNKATGVIRVKSPMDRESSFVKDGKYRATILAVDDDDHPATGTGTLVIQLLDVNDNPPTIEQREIKVCNKQSDPMTLSVTDKDGPEFGAPYRVDLQGDSRNNWTARMNDTKTGIMLTLSKQLEQGKYNVILRVYDNNDLAQDNTVLATVCDCTGGAVTCSEKAVAGFGLPWILGVLGAILALLLLVLLLLLFMRKKSTSKKEPLLADDDIRDNIYYYDEEGGGEDDQDYDLSVLHKGLDNRPDVFRNDVAPTFMSAPQYRPRPANPDEIGNFIDDNLKAADNDPTAPPYDSLLVFDYEGGGSEAGSLSSLHSDSSGDQDYDCLHEWGPRFKKLADMYGGGED